MQSECVTVYQSLDLSDFLRLEGNVCLYLITVSVSSQSLLYLMLIAYIITQRQIIAYTNINRYDMYVGR